MEVCEDGDVLDTVAKPDGDGAERISSGEVEALFLRFRPALLRFFERRAFAPADAEDMTQEVFLRITRLRGTQELWQPAGFLFQVAANVMRDRFRRDSARQQRQHIAFDDAEFEVHHAPSEEAVYEQRESLLHFLASVRELTPKCRMVFLLHKYEEMTYAEIARKLGVSVSAIEKHMMNAIRHIRQSRNDSP